ncbi:TetR/AcrR family transcriptional regulator [Gordonia terrae]|jgi:AcrR family transcriptional regulator|uniref:TetR/AcrR family transcriptional regulator n=2 Tax=Gordonia terrae TaxID=2055 RepID=A0AAD0NUD3_9ACTN|nr:TetR/AcrR family transcriptional regulator [Gordonia terrae]VTR09354.1 Bacterial regulatory proteins, tetR family [Clostridioides difficile]ANY22006.1 TetR family transcriptional regulator [Gordonia terrae]AWO82746.1 TetR/AcrR family transcriptional regulator [Gordonia terrae]VTS25511.1 Bacterial regulatory proteins, tetR family [Gordonia terrae]GAB45967.1 putative TetR family transcriptional regulator [Gordonia terrae NBRC 100016]
MTTRAESAAHTRQALLVAASALLDHGGPEAVTLREVGSGAGVSRSAAYRHFVGKDELLAAVAADAWAVVADGLDAISSDAERSPGDAVRSALHALSDLGLGRPHLYRLMFATPAGAPTIPAAARAQDGLVSLVGRIVGADAARHHAALLFAAAHGLTDLDTHGHLPPDKWHADRHTLIDLAVSSLPHGDNGNGAAGSTGNADV